MIRSWLFILSVGISGCTTTGNEVRVREMLSELREQHQFPGATLAWVSGEGDPRTVAVGMADPETGRVMTPDTRMPAASIGKSFVAAAVLDAAEQGLLDLDEPVSKWLGEKSWYSRLPNHQGLTIRHLLTHTGGLPDHVYLPAFQAMFQATRSAPEAPGPEQLIELVLGANPLFAPGEGWAYSDTGYLVAGMVLEAVTQQSWTRYVEERFLEPLSLDNTTPSDRRDLPHLATGITSGTNPFGLPERTVDNQGLLTWHPGIEGAGGGYVSNASDLARWGEALWSGQLHSGASFEAMLNGAPVDPDRPGVTYGLGVVIEENGDYGQVRGHRGWVPGYVSSLRYYPAHDTAIALQINSDVSMLGEEGMLMRIEAEVTRAILAGKTQHK